MEAGHRETCATTTGGGVTCWLPEGNAEVLPPGSGITSVVVGLFAGCGVTASGDVDCWRGSVAATTGVAGLAIGHNFSCAIISPGSVHCSGGVFSKNIGGLSGGAEAISAGESLHACALVADGGVKCFGENGDGQLGDATHVDSYGAAVDVVGLSADAVAISVGGVHGCALLTTGAVECWGANWHGQTGQDLTTTDASVPVGAAVVVDAGGARSCAITALGSAKCWGNSLLGDGSLENSSIPVDVAGSESYSAVAVGTTLTCALTMSGGVECWGYNYGGILGVGGACADYCTVPAGVLGLSGEIVDLAAGFGHACALIQTGKVFCWGHGEDGQLGNGGSSNSSVPGEVSGLADAVKIDAGEFHTCVVTSAGAVKCWGRGFFAVPLVVAGLESGIAAVSGGETHTCVLTVAGGARCWGENNHGELGNGTTSPVSGLQFVQGLESGVAAIGAGAAYFTCALMTDGSVKCWGDNGLGQLGNGTTDLAPHPLPEDVPELSQGIQTIDVGGLHTCALSVGGGVVCWGYNAFGKLGNGGGANASVVQAAIDTDNDGCTDQRELIGEAATGGERDPLHFWDFMDTFTGQALQRDKTANIADIAAIVMRFGSYDVGPGTFDRNSSPLLRPDAAVLPSGRRANYHPAYDRGGSMVGEDPWDLLPADGMVGASDLASAVAQFGHTCA